MIIRYVMPLLLFISIPSFISAADEKEVYFAEPGQDGVQRVEITAGSYFFKPARIIVKAGVPVELVLKKEPSLTPHNFILKAPEAGMDFTVPLSEEPKTVSFTPVVAGKYDFYCGKKLVFLKSHRERGMEGTLEVLEWGP